VVVVAPCPPESGSPESSLELLTPSAAASRAPGESGREEGASIFTGSEERACADCTATRKERQKSGRVNEQDRRDSGRVKDDNLAKLLVSHLSEKKERIPELDALLD
jgi:hypothetical protein